MSEFVEIAAKAREVAGKANRKLAPEGLIPAILYGADREPAMLSLDRHDFEHLLATVEGLHSSLVHVSVEGGGKPVNAMIREIQVHPNKGRVEHVDFMAIKMSQTLATNVPLHFEGESAGVKAGGVLTHNVREVHVEALPMDLPNAIVVDITALEVGDSLHVGDLTIPDGVTLLTDPEEIICSVTPPTKAPEVEEIEEVEAEVPEVSEGETTEE